MSLILWLTACDDGSFSFGSAKDDGSGALGSEVCGQLVSRPGDGPPCTHRLDHDAQSGDEEVGVVSLNRHQRQRAGEPLGQLGFLRIRQRPYDGHVTPSENG